VSRAGSGTQGRQGRGKLASIPINMGAHMKTTIDLSDDVMGRARAVQARSGRTLRSLVEEGLRLVVERLEQPEAPKTPFEIVPFQTGGMYPEFEGNWERLRDEIYPQ